MPDEKPLTIDRPAEIIAEARAAGAAGDSPVTVYSGGPILALSADAVDFGHFTETVQQSPMGPFSIFEGCEPGAEGAKVRLLINAT